ncbi:PAS domain S-box protein [Candidatus Sulfurimonas marisnigri]|uniref:histidine kinase n=1 Tax=Candidatus Sulfurimonas marisnigri TaxID=2740405 RepID=A0A7S7M1W2_9BACT|nr:PAS domain S-box protein [Candidatus Sulfurimonas marisnigri]QOY54978.1 PAS domain S-box protein [Candidatus Sulfurimonas marisnigri]
MVDTIGLELKNIIEALKNSSGQQFFERIVLSMASSMDVDYVFIARLDSKKNNSTTIALTAKGKIVDNFSYELKNTPCADVSENSVCCFTQDITKLYPKDQLLIDMNIEAYIGTPLHDSQGNVMGIIVALSERKIENEDSIKTLFEVFSGRIAVEMEREILETSNRQYKERLELALEGSSDGLWDWDLTTNELYLSPRWKEMLGYKDDELSNEFSTWKDNIHTEDIEQILYKVDSYLSHKTTVFEHTFRMKHKNGSWVWILGRGKAQFDKDGKPFRMLGYHTDITQSKTKEQEITRIKTLLNDIINSADNIIFVKDENFRYIECNTAFENFVSKSHKEVLGKSDYELFDKKNADFFREKDRLVMSENKAHSNYEWATRPDGTKAYFLTIRTILRNSEGKTTGIVGNAIDVTKEYKTQYEISKLKSVLNRSPVSIMMTNKDGTIEYVNPNTSAVSGYSREELIGKNPRIFKSGYISDEEYKKIWDHISSGKVWTGEFKNISKDGSIFWEDTTILPSFNEENEVNGYIAFKLEITEKIHLKQELKNQEEIMIAQSRHAAMGEMISMIAHQWRQPISVIAMGANNILADIELNMLDEVSLKVGSKEIINQTQELSKTIDDFRDFFRPGKTLENILPEDIFKDAFSVIGKSILNNNIEVIQEFNNGKEIITHSRELMQVLINILNNAKEALIESDVKNKKIVISINEISDGVEITICDNAGGIKEDIINKIFNPYFSTKNQNVGTGLGLYMSKTIIEKHLGGVFQVYNKHYVQGAVIGACFLIKLPYYKNEGGKS